MTKHARECVEQNWGKHTAPLYFIDDIKGICKGICRIPTVEDLAGQAFTEELDDVDEFLWAFHALEDSPKSLLSTVSEAFARSINTEYSSMFFSMHYFL